MPKFHRKRGSTSNMIRVFIQDNTSTKGIGLSGLSSSSTNLQISTIRELDSAPTTYTGANIESITTLGTYQAPSSSSKIRFKEVDATNMKGIYELHFHNSAASAFGAGDLSKSLLIFIFEVTTTALNIAPSPSEIELDAIDLQDGVRAGLTALPNAAAEAAGGLYTQGTGAGQINQPANGMIDGNMVRLLGTAIVTPATAGIMDTNVKNIGNAAVALDANNLLKVDTEDWKGGVIPAVAVTGVPKVDLVDIAGATVNSAAAQLGVNIVSQANIDFGALQKASLNAATPASVQGDVGGKVLGGGSGTIVGNGVVAGSVTGNIGGGVAGDIGGSVLGGVLGDIGGNLQGDVVGNVDGNVQGNVAGSVASVQGDVSGNLNGSVFGDVQGKVLGNGTSPFAAVGVEVEADPDVSDIKTALNGTLSSNDGYVILTADDMLRAGLQVDAKYSNGDPTHNLDATAVTNAVWNDGPSNHLTPDTFGEILGRIASAGWVHDFIDGLLTRDWTDIGAGFLPAPSRSLLNAARFIRNRFSTTANPGFVTVYQEDDTTEAYRKAIVTNNSAEPIVEG